MAIRIGVNAWVWQSPFTTAEHLDLVDKAAKMGFEVFEIGLEDPSHVDPGCFQKAARGQQPSARRLRRFGPIARSDARRSQVPPGESRLHSRRRANWREGGFARFWPGRCTRPLASAGMCRRSRRSRSGTWRCRGCARRRKIADDHGVKLAIEPLNRFETDLINTAEQCREADRRHR